MLWALSAGATQGTGCNRNSTAPGPHEVAIDTDAQGAGELIICMYLPSNCCGVFVGCVGAIAMGIRRVCTRVCICVRAHKDVYRLHGHSGHVRV